MPLNPVLLIVVLYPPKELSFLRNHEKRLITGERTVSIKALEQIQKALILNNS